MSTDSEVMMVRLYLTEGKHQLEQLIALLHDQYQVMGVTAFRGIAGFGRSGKLHASSLLDMSLDLPVVLEFFDTPEKIRPIIEQLQTQLEPGHIVTWSARMNT